jgi:hypothetical protein
MSIWRRLKSRLQRAFSADEGATKEQSAQELPFRAEDQKARILHLATGVLAGRLGLIEGSRQLHFCMGGFPDAFPYFTRLFEEQQLEELIPIFGGVAAAAEQFSPLPGSPDRHLWNAEVVAKRDRDREAFEASMRPQVHDACRKIMKWLSE